MTTQTEKPITTASDESMKQARKVVGDYIIDVCGFPSLSAYEKYKGDDLSLTVAIALDCARATGRVEGIKIAAQHCRKRGNGLAYHQDPTGVARQVFSSEADFIEALAAKPMENQ